MDLKRIMNRKGNRTIEQQVIMQKREELIIQYLELLPEMVNLRLLLSNDKAYKKNENIVWIEGISDISFSYPKKKVR